MPPEQDNETPAEETLPTSETAPVVPAETEVSDKFEEPDFSEIVDFVDNGEEESETPETDAIAEESGTPESSLVSEPEAGSEEPPAAEEPKPEDKDLPAKETPPEPEAKSEPEPEPKIEPEPEPEPEPELKLPTKEEMQGMYDTFREETLPVLEKLYEMDDEMAAAFDENPKEVLPKLAGRIQFEAMMSSYNAVMAALPSVVGRYLQAANIANSAENAFVEAWPQLNDTKHKQIVRTAIQSYRQANPTANLKDVIQKAGTLAMINAGLSLTPVEDKPKPKPKVKPAMPVAPGGSVSQEAPTRQTPESDNPFSDITEDWDKSNFG